MMFDDMKQNVSDWTDEEEVKNYLRKLLHKEAFDHAGLIYGMGHAVYSQSDPRAKVFKGFVESLSSEKGRHEEFALYSLVERLAPEVIAEERRIYKGVCANVDFYSGFVYRMLGIPDELFTPLFRNIENSRLVGSQNRGAHQLQQDNPSCIQGNISHARVHRHGEPNGLTNHNFAEQNYDLNVLSRVITLSRVMWKIVGHRPSASRNILKQSSGLLNGTR